MSLGIFNGTTLLGTAPRRRQRALGASTIPGTCWDKPGFKTCHAAQWQAAHDDCERTGAPDFSGNMSRCIEVMTDAYVFNNCMEKYCPQEPLLSKPVEVAPIFASGDPCDSKNTIKFVQWNVGTFPDGNWGTDSKKKYATYLASTGKDWYDIASGCVGTGPYPRRQTAVPVVEPPPVPEQIPLPATPPPQTGISKAALFGGIGVLSAIAIGAYYYSQKGTG